MRDADVSALVMVMAAPGTAAPVESWTAPEIWDTAPVCPIAEVHIAQTKSVESNVVFMNTPLKLSAENKQSPLKI